MGKIFLFLTFVLGFIGAFEIAAFAQATAPVVVPAAPTFLDGILSWLASNAPMVASGVAVIEVLLRLIPSSNALSILVPAKYVAVGFGSIFSWLGNSVLDPIIKSFNNVSSGS